MRSGDPARACSRARSRGPGVVVQCTVRERRCHLPSVESARLNEILPELVYIIGPESGHFSSSGVRLSYSSWFLRDKDRDLIL